MKKIPWLFLFLFIGTIALNAISLQEADKLLLQAQTQTNPSKKEELFNKAGQMYLDLFKNKKAPNYIVAQRLGEFYFFKYLSESNAKQKSAFLNNAVRSLEISIKNKPDFALAHAKMGEIYAVLHDFDLSRVGYENAVKYEPKNYIYRMGLAFSYSRRNYLPEAIDIYQKTLADFPKADIRLYLNYADVLRRLEKDEGYKKAVEVLNKAEKSKAEYLQNYDFYLYHDRGLNYLLLKNYKEAEKDFKKALSLNSKYALAYYHLGVAYYRYYSDLKPKNDKEPVPEGQMKYLKDAIAQMENALILDPSLDLAKSALFILSPTFEIELKKWKEATAAKIAATTTPKQLEDGDVVLKKLRDAMVERINVDRARHGLQPVKEDVIATKIGQINSDEQQEYHFLGHQSRDGTNPYFRYSQVGGNDYHAQNTAGRWGYRLNSADYKQVLEWILDSHYRMYSEVPPEDGHRRNILDPYRNYVGIGISYSGKDCYLTQEFLNRYIQFQGNIPKKVKKGQEFVVKGKPDKGYKVAGATIFYEPFPRPLTPKEIDEIPNYGLPATRLDLYKKLPAGYKYSNGSTGDIQLADSGEFAIPLKHYKDKGIYTLLIWLTDEKTGKVFAASTISVAVQ